MEALFAVPQTLNDPFQLGGLAPMFLCREIDQKPWSVECMALCDKHGADAYLFPVDGGFVRMKISGNASLNIRAMPLPMTPKVFTVFTSASVGASSKLP